MKIVTRLLWLFLLVAVLPLALFGYVNLQQYEATVRDEALERLAGLADKKVIQVKHYLMDRESEVRIRARSPQVIEAIGRIPKLYDAGRRNAEYIHADAKLHEYFERYIEETGLFFDVFLITPQGEIVYSQRHEADFASNLITGPYRDTQLAQAFRAASMTLEPVISGYQFYAPSQAPALFIAAPIMADGKFKGVFAAQLGNELLYKVATDANGLGSSGEVTFTQRDGEGALYTTPLKYRSDAAMKLRQNLQEIKRTPVFDALSGETGEGVKPDYRGTPVVAAWRYLPELAWGMVVKIDVDEVFAPINQQRMLLLKVLLGLLLFAGWIAYYFGRQISVPLAELARSAGEMSKGELGQRVDESTPGEIGMFAQAFNRMAENMQALYRTLENRVEERTRDLYESNKLLQGEIAEREHIAKVLRESEERWKFALEGSGDGVWDWNIQTGEALYSKRWKEMFGFAESDIGNASSEWSNRVHPEDMPHAMEVIQAHLDGKTPSAAIEFRMLCKDGSWRWTLGRGMMVSRDTDGKPLRLVGTNTDITERKNAEEALRVAAATFETHEAILITDANANIIRVNQAFQDITGYSPEEVLGKNPRILSSGREDKTFYAEMWQQLLKTGTWSGEMWDRRKNGQVYPKWLTITAINNEQGQTTEYVGIFSDITSRKQAEEEIHNLAFYDALTKLPNRRLLLDRFRLALSVSARSHHYGAVLFLDMDRFKTLNDTLGHDYGDLLLIEVAVRIQSCVREVDTVARLGGDEFVVLLEEVDTGAEQASQKVALIAEKIRAALAAPYRLKDHEYHSSPSIGVCLYRGNTESVDALLKHADLAMYQAKNSGRNVVRFFDPAMQHAVETHAALEADLRHAVPNKQLRLHYQIQLDNDHRPLGAEALVRWMHPKRGMVTPAQFIPIAEESSLILDIGYWVLETACRQLAMWSKREQTRDLVLAVNVSAQQFRKHDFVKTVVAALRAHQADPSRLKLELTESVVLSDVADVVAKMHALKALGIKLSLDDFGTGFSSLSYLKRLPLDQIKIDQSFVRDIATDPSDAVMVQTIINLAQNFRLSVIAEGVETEAQLDFLKQNGCMAYQGYLFSRPVPVDEFEELLKSDLTRSSQAQ